MRSVMVAITMIAAMIGTEAAAGDGAIMIEAMMAGAEAAIIAER